MKTEISLDWVHNLTFSADVAGHQITIDPGVENGGDGLGPRPKPLMMVSLAGCTAIDVVSILRKMKVDIKGLSIKVEGDILDDFPKNYLSMHVIYIFKGHNLPLDKLERAVELSKEKYCGVSATLQKAIPITYSIQIQEA